MNASNCIILTILNTAYRNEINSVNDVFITCISNDELSTINRVKNIYTRSMIIKRLNVKRNMYYILYVLNMYYRKNFIWNILQIVLFIYRYVYTNRIEIALQLKILQSLWKECVTICFQSGECFSCIPHQHVLLWKVHWRKRKLSSANYWKDHVQRKFFVMTDSLRSVADFNPLHSTTISVGRSNNSRWFCAYVTSIL